MNRLTNRRNPRPAKRARDEASAAWDHLKAAAEHGARRVGDTSRRTRGIARERASNAALALRGETPRSTTRKWLGTGLAIGAAIGAAGAALLGRRRNSRGPDDSHEVREKANSAMETVREKATTAAHKAATTARDTASKVREVTKSREHGNGHIDRDPSMEPDPTGRPSS
jgi:gas vesicle protein